VSKRHQSNRRKTYGRRQHELHERHQRDHHPAELEDGLDDVGAPAIADRLAFLDPRTPRLRFASGD
jgi:hypothetical protein